MKALKLVTLSLSLIFVAAAEARYPASDGSGGDSLLRMRHPKKIDLFPRHILMQTVTGTSQPSSIRTRTRPKRSDFAKRWTVTTFRGKRVLNTDIEKFAYRSKLTDEKMISLFRKANKDLDKYKQLRSEWVVQEWDAYVRQFLYYKILEDVVRKQARKRKAFTTTKRQLWDMQDKNERDLLKTYLDKGRGIRYAREKFGEFLIAQDYPHSDSDSTQDVYFRWKKLQDGRIREAVRAKEAMKFEATVAHPAHVYARAGIPYDRNIMSMGRVHDMNKRARKAVDTFFSRSRTNRREVVDWLKKNLEAEAVIKTIEGRDLMKTTLKEMYNRDRMRFNFSTGRISTIITSKFNSRMIDKAINYEKIAGELAKKYKTEKKLQKKISEANRKSAEAGDNDYTQLMLARLYTMALLKVKGEARNRTQLLSSAKDRLTRAFATIRRSAKSSSFFRLGKEADFIAPEVVGLRLAKASSLASISNEYEKAVVEMGIWVAKFEVKRFAKADQTTFHPVIREYQKFEAQPFLAQLWEDLEFNKTLERYYERTLKRKYKYSFEIDRKGSGHRMSNRTSINFIFE